MCSKIYVYFAEEENVEQQSNYNSNSNGDYHQPQEPGSSTEHASYDGQEVVSQEQGVSQVFNNNDGVGSGSTDGQNGLTDFHSQTGSQQSGQDFEERPTINPNYILRPVSTTIIHSPESSSYSAQSFGSQSFRPQKVIVHDFTKGGGSSGGAEEMGTVPSPSFSVPQEESYGQPSQAVQSWQTFNVRPKSPKLVEEYNQQVEDDEDKQSLASVSNSKIVQYQNVATGLMTPAECATAHSHSIQLTASTQDRNTGTEEDLQLRNGEKVDKTRYRLGESRLGLFSGFNGMNGHMCW